MPYEVVSHNFTRFWGEYLDLGKLGPHLQCYSAAGTQQCFLLTGMPFAFSMAHLGPTSAILVIFFAPKSLDLGIFISTSREWNKETLHIKDRQHIQKVRFYGATCVGENGTFIKARGKILYGERGWSMSKAVGS